jgi:hypothetical protein
MPAPNSRTNVYRVDPETLAADFIFEAKDHIGGIVRNVHNNTLHGVSWGSRRRCNACPVSRAQCVLGGADAKRLDARVLHDRERQPSRLVDLRSNALDSSLTR